MKVLVLLSGGLDSTTALHVAKHEGHTVHSLTFSYEQKNQAEIWAAREIANDLPVRSHFKMVVDTHPFFSPLTTKGLAIPTQRSPEIITNSGISPMYVPARNTVFLSLALAWAESLKLEAIYIGANKDDENGFPDCRRSYFAAWQAMANLATATPAPTLLYPFIDKTKSEIVGIGLSLGIDYSKTVSCYQQEKNKPPCGICDACVLRAGAMADNGIVEEL